jgi:type II secretory pathway pseudopilin PulG
MKVHDEQQKPIETLSKQGGFLSIEMIIVIIVVLGLIIFGASKSDALRSGSGTSEEVSNIQMLHTSTKLLRGSGGYGPANTDLTEQLIATKGIPTNMPLKSNVLYNSFGGVVTIKSTGLGFTITSNSLPGDVCSKVTNIISRGGLFSTIKINSNPEITGEGLSAVTSKQCDAKNNAISYTSAF